MVVQRGGDETFWPSVVQLLKHVNREKTGTVKITKTKSINSQKDKIDR